MMKTARNRLSRALLGAGCSALITLAGGAVASAAPQGSIDGKAAAPAPAPGKAVAGATPGQTEKTPSAAPQQASDPFLALRLKIPKNRLPPLQSVRIRDRRERASGRIRVSVKTSPKGAVVTHGRSVLGNTPLRITARRGSTPLDIVIRRKGYMTLRTRIMRNATRTYRFRLHPAKLR